MQTKLSIIVPVYNVERYLAECLDSILNQTLTDFELILVNDGSTDSSGRICDEYVQKDDRIKVIHISNGGAANARNTGLEQANGELIGFVDSDDWIEPDMFRSLCEKAESTSSDLVFCDYITESENGSVNEKCYHYDKCSFNRDEIIKMFLPYFFGYADSELTDYKTHCPLADYHSYNYICVYQSEIIQKSEIRFKSERAFFNEDNLFNLDYIFQAKKITYLPEYFYHYRYNSNSISKSFNQSYFECKLRKFEYLTNFIIDNHLGNEYLHRLENKIAIEAVSIVNYYAGTSLLKLPQKHQYITDIAKTQTVKQCVSKINLKRLPLSKVKIYLYLLKMKAHWAIVIISSVYRSLNR